MEFNIYCDESCHLENDQQSVMILSAIRCLKSERKQIYSDIRNIKITHGISPTTEVKWTKVSKTKINLYKELIEYFFASDNISFRAVIIDKNQLDIKKYNKNFDEFYYKVYFQLLTRIIVASMKNYIYLDIKDTRSSTKVKKLQEVLSNDLFDFNMEHIMNVQSINSRESELLQIADVMMGAIGYLNRNEHLKENFSETKKELLNFLIEKSGYSLKKSTILGEDKFNLFFMQLRPWWVLVVSDFQK